MRFNGVEVIGILVLVAVVLFFFWTMKNIAETPKTRPTWKQLVEAAENEKSIKAEKVL